MADAIGQQIAPFETAVELLCTIPGVQRRNAECIIAEIGVDMSVFPTAKQLASWAGQCPGNDQSVREPRFRRRGADTAARRLSRLVAALRLVRLIEPVLIGQLVAQSTQELAARIDGPRWQIAHDNPVRLQAARQAAADAEGKAQAYAEGVGATLGRLMRLTEPDHAHAIARAAAGLRPMAAEPMPVEPGEHEGAASIHATFALELNRPRVKGSTCSARTRQCADGFTPPCHELGAHRTRTTPTPLLGADPRDRQRRLRSPAMIMPASADFGR
ncbi:MAG: SIMPL domain-containing protein [Solirubrobacteraceae bacterium]